MSDYMSLTDWQKHCSDYMLGGEKSCSVSTKGLSIYKDSITAIHHNALKISFPILRELLGSRIFTYLANDYIKDKNWQSASLDEFGYDLSEFVHQHRQLSSMPYMSELAAIEWEIQSLPEYNEPVVGLEQHLHTLLDNHQDIKIRTRPNVAFMQSKYGGIETWLAHQTELVCEVNLDEIEPSNWYLMRTADGFSADVISLELYQLVTSMKYGISMTYLCQQNGVDVAVGQLQALLENQLISFH